MASKHKPSSHLHVLLIAAAVILFWRGAWGFMDLFLFPNDKVLSYGISLVVGIAILIITDRLIDELI